MSPKLEYQLYVDFPVILQNLTASSRGSLMAFGFECQDGWYVIIRCLLSELKMYSEKRGFKVIATQVKEKFGRLRFYYNLEDCIDDAYADTVREIVYWHEEQTASICEFSGEKGSLHKRGGLFKTVSPKEAKNRGFTKV